MKWKFNKNEKEESRTNMKDGVEREDILYGRENDSCIDGVEENNKFELRIDDPVLIE